MEMEVEASLVGDGGCSREVSKEVPLKGARRKRYKKVVLGLVKRSKKRRMGKKEEGSNLEVGIEGLPSCVRAREVGKRRINLKELE
jgi:hypothetical protein